MKIEFPCRSGPAYKRYAAGYPVEAKPCKCDRPVSGGEGTCIKCGRLFGADIRRTFEEAAVVESLRPQAAERQLARWREEAA